jgi:hypothetical protein
MSIAAEIDWRVGENRLFPLIPRAPGSAARRAMFVSEGIHAMLAATHADPDMEDRIGTLQADLELFAEGQPIDPKYLFRLYPAVDAVWEIRSVRPEPSIRVLGLFAARNVFIATNMALREDLGGWQSREWKNIKRAARAQWNQLFHTYQPMTSSNIHDLVTGAVSGKYFKA